MSKAVQKDTGYHYSIENAGKQKIATGTISDFAKAVGSRFVFNIQLQTEAKDLIGREAFTLAASGVRKLKKLRDARIARSKAKKQQKRVENITCAVIMVLISAYMVYYSLNM